MKKLILTVSLSVLSSFAFSAPAGYVDPVSFDGSDSQKGQVIKYIKANVYKDYCKQLGQCSATMLRMMEEEELKSFKFLAAETKKHEKEYRQVYKDYCETINMCNYGTLKMMFNKEVESASKELTW